MATTLPKIILDDEEEKKTELPKIVLENTKSELPKINSNVLKGSVLEKFDDEGNEIKVGVVDKVKNFFKKDVVEPIKYHVLAKRYLANNKRYYNQLSDASKISLKLQGGVLNKKQMNEFEKKPFFKNAIKLRKFDELAKKTNIKIKSINDYKDLLSSQLL